MNLKKLDLLTLLIGLFLFASCKDNDSTIGLDLDPNTSVQGTLVDSLTVNSRTEREAAAQTYRISRHPLGFMNDPVFGTTESSLALGVSTTGEAGFDFGTTPILDSAVLVLNFGTQLYGDTAASVYSIDVRQLGVNIAKDENFPSDRTYPSDPFLIGNYTGKIYPNTKFKIVSLVTGKPDTLKSVSPQLRIKLDPTFIKNGLIDLGTLTLKDEDLFSTFFRGFKVNLNRPASSGNLGILFFDFASTNSRMEVYYKKLTSTGGRDTILSVFPISTQSKPVAATIVHNYTGTPVATQLSTPNVQYPVTYVQGLAGLRTRISFPYLNKFAASAGKIILNKAELVVDVSAGTDVAPFSAAPRLALYRSDIASQRENLIDQLNFHVKFGGESSGDVIFGGYFDSLKKHYVYVVTNYIQDIINGKDSELGTYLAVSPTTEFIFKTPVVSAAARSVIGTGAKNTAGALINPNNKIKLNLYYTKVN